MKAQRQRAGGGIPEARSCARRAGHLGEQEFAELREHLRRQAQRAVSGEQRQLASTSSAGGRQRSVTLWFKTSARLRWRAWQEPGHASARNTRPFVRPTDRAAVCAPFASRAKGAIGRCGKRDGGRAAHLRKPRQGAAATDEFSRRLGAPAAGRSSLAGAETTRCRHTQEAHRERTHSVPPSPPRSPPCTAASGSPVRGATGRAPVLIMSCSARLRSPAKPRSRTNTWPRAP